jgi:ADP-ribose pyrophosphatase YjhB (NUDIX family)
MIQRKDSICYVEFIRGKYSLAPSDQSYIMHLFKHMTFEERDMVRRNDFDRIWDALWMNNRRNHSEYHISKDKYAALKKGVMLKGTLFNIDYVLDNTTCCLRENEYEFPKGRKNSVESTLECAFREFEEESGIAQSKLELSDKFKPVIFDKTGCNGVEYRSFYYVAKCIDNVDATSLLHLNDVQAKEVRCVRWMDYSSVVSKMHTEKAVRLFERFNKRLLSFLTDAV